MWVFCKYITKNGKRIYPKNAKYFRFWVDDEDSREDKAENNDVE